MYDDNNNSHEKQVKETVQHEVRISFSLHWEHRVLAMVK